MKVWAFSVVGFVILFGLLALTNPNEDDYYAYEEKEYTGSLLNFEYVELERINFIVFSTYTPFVHSENGITHLGVFGVFIQISDGQFDYPKWMNLFK